MAKPLSETGVVFDLDGTLVDTARDLAASMNVALEQLGLPAVPADAVRHLVGRGARAMLARGVELGASRPASEDELDRGLEHFLAHYFDNIAVHSEPFDGVVALMDRLLEDGAALAVCTNKREGPARALLAALGLSDRFASIVGADTLDTRKPDAAPVRRCLEEIGARRAVFIGDSDTDIRAAAAAGLPCLIADFGYGPTDLLDEAPGVFSSYADVEPRLRALLSP